MKQPVLAGFVLAGIVLSTSSTASAAQTAEACQAAKLKATAKATTALLKCHATAAKSGDPVDIACLDSAGSKFAEGFAKVETKGGCSPAGDLADYEDAVETFVAAVVAEGLCAAKIKAVGAAAKGGLKCHGTAIKKGVGVDPACLDAAEAKLTAAFDKADAKGCTPTGGATTAQSHVDELLDDILGPAAATEIRIFRTDTVHTGVIGDRATSSGICAASASSQALSCPGGTIALLSYTGDAVADFPASAGLATDLPIVAGAATVASDWADFLDAQWSGCLDSFCSPAGPTPGNIMAEYSASNVRTGTNSNGTAAAENCSNWTSTATTAKFLSPYCYGTVTIPGCVAGHTLGNTTNGNCSVPVPFLCLCY